MRRFVHVLAVATVTGGLAVIAGPTMAAAATCQAVPATITASDVARVDGTEGNDVIVAEDVGYVVALGGDDLVCITGSRSTGVDAGAGNDVVDASGAAGGTSTALGDGDDTYLGSTAVDSVHTGTTDGDDTGRDTVATGPRGEDYDYVTSGQGAEPNADRITGSWVTLIWAGTPARGSSAVGGRGSLFATVDRAARKLVIDTRAGTYSSGSGPVLDLRGFASFQVRASGDLERFTFRGSNRGEALSISDAPRPVVRVAMADGDDRVTAGTYGRGSSISGGPGRDHLDVMAPAHLDLDLRRETLTKGTGAKAVTFEADGFEDAFVRADTARLVGTDAPNTLVTDACSTQIAGRGANDRLTAINNTGYDQAGRKCRSQGQVTARLLGGPGNDTLKGSNAMDLLDGGPGRDKANGDHGRDTCRSEVRTSCEVRR